MERRADSILEHRRKSDVDSLPEYKWKRRRLDGGFNKFCNGWLLLPSRAIVWRKEVLRCTQEFRLPLELFTF